MVRFSCLSVSVLVLSLLTVLLAADVRADVVTVLGETGSRSGESGDSGVPAGAFGRAPGLVGPGSERMTPLERRERQALHDRAAAVALERALMEGRNAALVLGAEAVSADAAVDLETLRARLADGLQQSSGDSTPLIPLGDDVFGGLIFEATRDEDFRDLLIELGGGVFAIDETYGEEGSMIFLRAEGRGSSRIELIPMPTVDDVGEVRATSFDTIGDSEARALLEEVGLTLPPGASEFFDMSAGKDMISVAFRLGSDPRTAVEALSAQVAELGYAIQTTVKLPQGEMTQAYSEGKMISLLVMEDDERPGMSSVLIQTNAIK